MNNRNLEYDTLADLPRGVAGFLDTILKATPNGEYVAVQYHPNGDWTVGGVVENPGIIPEIVLEARRRAARRPANPLSAERILKGMSDNGALVKEELKNIERERLFAENGVRLPND